VYTLNDVSTVEEHTPYVLRVDGAREVRIAEMSTIRHRYFLPHRRTEKSNTPAGLIIIIIIVVVVVVVTVIVIFAAGYSTA